jgi:beta-glucosidase
VIPADDAIEELISRMTLAEKAGQMSQLAWRVSEPTAWDERVREGLVGSFLNAPTLDERNRLQRLATTESRLGIPLVFGRDVIHGFRTVFPLPLGQASTFDPVLVERCAAVAAKEASEMGIDWTFAPMVDIGRDPRWGRVAECTGEDPFLAARMGTAMVRGFQGDDPGAPGKVAACAKHFAGYGMSESGKDYSTTWIPELLLREVHLPPFEACVRAGVLTLMSAFTDLNGTPATANAFLLDQVLRGEWNFSGFVVSDWGSTSELVVHGRCEDERQAALASARAGLDMEMAAETFCTHLPALVESGALDVAVLDTAVRRVLAVKRRLGLFEAPLAEPPKTSCWVAPEHLELSRRSARESFVLLKNEPAVLPLRPDAKVALIGCLADDGKNQLGCWAFDGDVEAAVTIRTALAQRLGHERVLFARGLPDARAADTSEFPAALSALHDADLGVVVLGEHWNISGECRSRAFLDLPGAQGALLEALAQQGKPLVLVVLTGRPLCLGEYAARSQAVLVGFHPGTATGPALVDLLFGDESPSGKLPMSFPRAVGQIPVYYAARRGGRPAMADQKGIPQGTPLDPVGFDAGYLDVEVSPLYPFGYGLSYTTFDYGSPQVNAARVRAGETFEVSCEVTNTGACRATEVVQLYVRDCAGSVTRPARELRGFERVELEPGQAHSVRFVLDADALSFTREGGERVLEPGRFELFVGGDSRASARADFVLI